MEQINESIKVSIIVPVYNVEKYLKRCVDSLCNQTYTNIEIILIDDGSTDSSGQKCDDHHKNDVRIKVYHQQNKGLSGARNTGIIHSTGEYLMFVDSDDYIANDAVEHFVKIANAHEPDVVIGEAVQISGKTIKPMVHHNLIPGKNYTGKEYIIAAIKDRAWYAPVWLNLYKKIFIAENNLFFKEGIFHEDLEIEPRWAMCAKKIVYVNGVFYFYEKREDSITCNKQKEEKRKKDIFSILNGWKRSFDDVVDTELQKYLYGMLLKQFLYFSRVYKNTDRRAVSGINMRFILQNSLDHKELIKGMIYMLAPQIYVKL